MKKRFLVKEGKHVCGYGFLGNLKTLKKRKHMRKKRLVFCVLCGAEK